MLAGFLAGGSEARSNLARLHGHGVYLGTIVAHSRLVRSQPNKEPEVSNKGEVLKMDLWISCSFKGRRGNEMGG